MELTTEQLEELEHMAGLQFTLKEIAVILSVDFEALRRAYLDEDSAVRNGMEKGRLLSEAKLREVLKRDALQGSPTAQKDFINLINKAKQDDSRHQRKG